MGEEMHAIGRNSLTKAAVLGDSIQLTPGEQQKGAQVTEELDIINSEELVAGCPPAGRPASGIDTNPRATRSFVPRCRPPVHHEEIKIQSLTAGWSHTWRTHLGSAGMRRNSCVTCSVNCNDYRRSCTS